VMVATGAAALAPASSERRRAWRRLAGGLAALDVASTLPLVAHARRQGRAVALAALPLALLRAAALDLGLAWGFLDRLAGVGSEGPG
jgi:hypothetical protein